MLDLLNIFACMCLLLSKNSYVPWHLIYWRLTLSRIMRLSTGLSSYSWISTYIYLASKYHSLFLFMWETSTVFWFTCFHNIFPNNFFKLSLSTLDTFLVQFPKKFTTIFWINVKKFQIFSLSIFIVSTTTNGKSLNSKALSGCSKT